MHRGLILTYFGDSRGGEAVWMQTRAVRLMSSEIDDLTIVDLGDLALVAWQII